MRTISALGPILYDIPYAFLRDMGVLAQSEVRMVPFHHQAADPDEDTVWARIYRVQVVRNHERNRLLADIAVQAAKPCMLFVDETEQGERILKLLRERNLLASYVDGSAPKPARERAVRDLAEGKVDVLICTVIFQEGIDVPTQRSVIAGGGKKSAVACLQRMGRGMRTSAGKTTFELWDVFDRGHAVMERHARERIRVYEEAGHEPIESSLKKT
jgi:superfamily II DNA or RNA helicase